MAPVVTRNTATVKRRSMVSDPQSNDAAHHEVADEQTRCAVEQQEESRSALNHGAEVLRVVDEHEGADDEGQCGQHEARHASLRGHDLNVTLELRPLADG